MSSVGENVDDRLSRLPEDTLSHMLSLMPTKYAVRTSVLSKRWRYSWMLVTNLDFDDTDTDTDTHSVRGSDNFSKFVDRVTEFCKTSQLRTFRLRFSNKAVPKSSVSSWIGKAVGLNVREVDVQVDVLDAPLSLLNCKTLTKLRLDVSARDCDVWECPSSVNLPCVKTLDIVVYTNPHANAFQLIRGCPMLESLSLEVIWSANSGDYVFNIPTLKRFKLTLQDCGYAVNGVVLHLPNLEYLFVGGILGSLFFVKDLPTSVEASVSFNWLASSECTILDLWGVFLKGISGVKSLSIQKVLCSSLPIFPNIKHLDLKSFGYSGRFLENCPELEHLCIEKVGESYWIEPKLVPACLLTHLATIKFSTRTRQECDMKFLEYMLGKAEVLKTVTITWEDLSIEEEKQLCAELLNLPRASRHCEIHFTAVKGATGHGGD